MNIEHISVSRVNVWHTCQQQYKYRYHLKVIPEGTTPFYLTYGNIVHKVAEEYVRAGGKRQITEVAADVMNGRILLKEGVHAPKMEGDYNSKFPKHLRCIKKLTERIGFDGKLEWPFHYDLEPPSNHFITGFIDRLIERRGKFFIIDYKTTKKGPWRKTAATIVDDLQMRVYAMVVQKEFGAKAEDIRAALFYLEGCELISTKFTQESLDAAAQEMRQAYHDIQGTNPETVWGNVGWHCQRCDYNDICPFYQASI